MMKYIILCVIILLCVQNIIAYSHHSSHHSHQYTHHHHHIKRRSKIHGPLGNHLSVAHHRNHGRSRNHAPNRPQTFRFRSINSPQPSQRVLQLERTMRPSISKRNQYNLLTNELIETREHANRHHKKKKHKHHGKKKKHKRHGHKKKHKHHGKKKKHKHHGHKKKHKHHGHKKKHKHHGHKKRHKHHGHKKKQKHFKRGNVWSSRLHRLQYWRGMKSLRHARQKIYGSLKSNSLHGKALKLFHSKKFLHLKKHKTHKLHKTHKNKAIQNLKAHISGLKGKSDNSWVKKMISGTANLNVSKKQGTLKKGGAFAISTRSIRRKGNDIIVNVHGETRIPLGVDHTLKRSAPIY